ncbi:MAG: hypothetical protein U0Q18_37475 [Bryobacteraceae bacterium]
MRKALVFAIASCADKRHRPRARGFLQGLSSDELAYVAEYLGACVIESSAPVTRSRRELADSIAQFERWRCSLAGGSNVPEHKLVVLLECLCRCNLMQYSLAVRERTKI